MPQPPIIDIAALLDDHPQDADRAAHEIAAACRDVGFFYVRNHGVAASTLAALEHASVRFFALSHAAKMEIAMEKGGRAWRGYFPLGGELTSGKPDLKEGLYLGEELDRSDPRVEAGWPLHGPNLFPAQIPELRPAVLGFMQEASTTARAILEGLAISLGLERSYFERRYTGRPTMLFRIFRYPPSPPDGEAWGVGEHTDYGLLTLLAQDSVGGLEVKTPNDGWIEAPPIPDALVCNIGDMLDRLTGGHYRSTPHRVRNGSGRERYSFPFFFDPGFDAVISPLPERVFEAIEDKDARWDRASVRAFTGTYGDYLLAKVAKVFPDLASSASIGDR
jgi:isopenicillin N synthase-like dioxygenase